MSDSTPDSTSDSSDDTTGRGSASQAAADAGTGSASAGIPSGAAPSGATTPGHEPEDARDDVVPASAGAQSGDGRERAVPGQLPGTSGVSPVPSPGSPVGVTSPGVRAAQGPSPDDGVHAGDKGEGSDAAVTSPGAWTAAAAPGKPDGEVDTRSR